MRPFFLRIVRKGKRKPNTHKATRTNKASKEDKQRATKTKPLKIGKERQTGARDKKEGKRIKTRANKGKIEANTLQAFNPPNYSRAQKPRKPRKAPNQYKPTQAPQTTLKTALKREIGAYFKPKHQKQSSKGTKAGRKGRNTHRRTPEAHAPCTTCTEWTRPPPQRESHNGSPCNPQNPNIYLLLPFSVSDFPEKTPSTPQRFIYFCPFLPKICPDRLKIDDRREGRQAGRKPPLLYAERA